VGVRRIRAAWLGGRPKVNPDVQTFQRQAEAFAGSGLPTGIVVRPNARQAHAAEEIIVRAQERTIDTRKLIVNAPLS